MTFQTLLSQTAQVYRRGDTGSADRHGNPATQEAPAVTYPCRLEQTVGREATDRDRTTMISEFRLFLPGDAAVDGSDRIVVDGVSYDVEGDPFPVRGRRRVHHLEVRLKRVEG